MLNKRILIIEDSRLAKEFRERLLAENFRLTTVRSLEEAVSYLKTNGFSQLSVIFSNQSKKILVVEDNPELMEVIEAGLRQEGFEVIKASSVQEAISKANQGQRIDAIWLDHYLADNETGLDFISYLRKTEDGRKKIPIIVVSNVSTLAEQQLYNAFGIDRFYPKANYRLKHIISDMKRFLN